MRRRLVKLIVVRGFLDKLLFSRVVWVDRVPQKVSKNTIETQSPAGEIQTIGIRPGASKELHSRGVVSN